MKLFLFSRSCVAVGALLVSTLARSQTPSPTPTALTSLKGKTDQELVEFITGQKLPPAESVATLSESIKPSPVDRLWEMAPTEAALAIVSDYTDSQFPLKIENPTAKPPKKGEVGLRWVGGGHYVPVSHGVTILKYDGYKSELLVSELEIRGQASKDEIEEAVKKTDSHRVRRLVAQQTYEIIWWLGHVRFRDETNTPGWRDVLTLPDLPTRFWINPGGTVIKGVFTRSDESLCGGCIAKGNKDAYAEFAGKILDRLIQRSGIQRRYPMPTVGRYIDQDDDAKFLQRTAPPDPSNPTELKHWIARLAQILRNPTRQYLHDQVMEILVPISDPLRYQDPEIDNALLVVMHRGLATLTKLKELADAQNKDNSEDIIVDLTDAANDAKEKERAAKRKKRDEKERQLRDLLFNGMEAVEKLGFPDATGAFTELLKLAKQSGDNRPLIAAASIAGRHPELRPQLTDYLRAKLLAKEEAIARGTPLLEAIWRGDLRDLTPTLEKLADLPRPTPNPRDVRESSVEKASLILAAWRETDLLTKTKIDTLLSSVLGGGNSIPEVLRAEFEALSAEDKFTFRQFINWMRTAGASVHLRYLENTFTPHTPRPDILFER